MENFDSEYGTIEPGVTLADMVKQVLGTLSDLQAMWNSKGDSCSHHSDSPWIPRRAESHLGTTRYVLKIGGIRAPS